MGLTDVWEYCYLMLPTIPDHPSKCEYLLVPGDRTAGCRVRERGREREEGGREHMHTPL